MINEDIRKRQVDTNNTMSKLSICKKLFSLLYWFFPTKIADISGLESCTTLTFGPCQNPKSFMGPCLWQIFQPCLTFYNRRHIIKLLQLCHYFHGKCLDKFHLLVPLIIRTFASKTHHAVSTRLNDCHSNCNKKVPLRLLFPTNCCFV